EGCRLYASLQKMDGLAQLLRENPAVQTTTSLAETVSIVTLATMEGSGKWLTLTRIQSITDGAVSSAIIASPDITNQSCSVSPLIAYLTDHKADTLSSVLRTAEDFANANNTAAGEENSVQFLLAAGSAGIEAATNIEVQKSIVTMYLAVYGATA